MLQAPFRPPVDIAIHFVQSDVLQTSTAAGLAGAWLLTARQMLTGPLAERGMASSFGSTLLPGAINVATGASLARLWRPYFRSFIVGLRADAAELAQCDWEIVPTGLELPSDYRTSIDPWNCASTAPRNCKHLNRVRNLVFVSISDLDSCWRDATNQVNQLLQLGVSCRIESAPVHDLSDIDVLVADCAALRQAAAGFYSPLLAAWRAGIPAILIDTEQERFQRSSALDYLSISGPEQLAKTVGQLQSHPQLYEAMRQRATERARQLRDNLITRRWVETLAEVIAPQATAILKARRAQPIRAVALQAGRWLLHR